MSRRALLASFAVLGVVPLVVSLHDLALFLAGVASVLLVIAASAVNHALERLSTACGEFGAAVSAIGELPAANQTRSAAATLAELSKGLDAQR